MKCIHQPLTPAIQIWLLAPEYDHSSNVWDQNKGLHLLSPTVSKHRCLWSIWDQGNMYNISLNSFPVSSLLWLRNFLGQRRFLCIQESSEGFSSTSLQSLPFKACKPLGTYGKDFCSLPAHGVKNLFWPSPVSIISSMPIHPHDFTYLISLSQSEETFS